MSWHYRVRKRLLDGEEWFDMVEYYTDPDGWTRREVAPGADTYDELVAQLQRMLDDAKERPILHDTEAS